HPTTPTIHTLSLHDALPTSRAARESLYPTHRPAHRPVNQINAKSRTLRCPAPARSRPDECCRRPRPYHDNTSRARTSRDKCNLRSEEHTSELQSREKLVCRL